MQTRDEVEEANEYAFYLPCDDTSKICDARPETFCPQWCPASELEIVSDLVGMGSPNPVYRNQVIT